MINSPAIIKPIPIENRYGKKIGVAEGNLRAAIAMSATVNRLEAERKLELRYPIVAGGSVEESHSLVRASSYTGLDYARQPNRSWKWNRGAKYWRTRTLDFYGNVCAD